MSEPGEGGTDTDPEMIQEEAAEALVEVRGELKAYLRMIDRPDPPITPDELQKTAGIRDLVGLDFKKPTSMPRSAASLRSIMRHTP